MLSGSSRRQDGALPGEAWHIRHVLSEQTSEQTLDQPEAASGAGSAVAERILQAIVSLEFEPGSVVTETTLMAWLSVGRSSVREAVQRLAPTGLVSVRPRVGVAIAPVSLLDVENVYEARHALERTIVRLAAARGTDRGLEELGRLARLPSRGPGLGSVAHDRALHGAIARLAGNAFLERALDNVLVANARVWSLFFRLNGRRDEYLVSHDRIVNAIAARDPDAAEAAVRSHLEASREVLERVFWRPAGNAP